SGLRVRGAEPVDEPDLGGEHEHRRRMALEDVTGDPLGGLVMQLVAAVTDMEPAARVLEQRDRIELQGAGTVDQPLLVEDVVEADRLAGPVAADGADPGPGPGDRLGANLGSHD